MPLIFWGSLILFICTAIFYLVFYGLVYYWHERKTTFVVVPLLYTFEFFICGFLVVATLMLLVNFTPQIIDAVAQILDVSGNITSPVSP